jgi:AAA domain
VSSPTSILNPGETEALSESPLPVDVREEGSKAELPQPEAPEPGTPKPEPVPQEKKQPEWEIRNLEDAYKGAEAPPWIIKDLVMSGTLTLVSAHPHGMKSLSWLIAAMQGVHRKRVFDHFEAPNLKNVLFIETEDPAWLLDKRIQGIAKGLKLPDGATLPGFHYTCPGPFELIKQEKQLEGLVEKYNLDLIVLSTLQNLLGGKNWKEQGEMAEVMAMLVRLARKCPIVLLTHSPQDRTQKRAIGTITLGANCATHIHYEKTVKADGTYIHLKVNSKAGAEETDFSLLLHADRKDPDPVGSVRGMVYAGKGNRGKTKEQPVIEAMAENPNATVAELAEIVGCDESHVRTVKRKLAKEKGQKEDKPKKGEPILVN